MSQPTEPAYTITGLPANPEAALADTLICLQTFTDAFVPLTARQRLDKQRVLLTIDRARRFLPGYVPPPADPVPVVVATDAPEEFSDDWDWGKGRQALGRGEKVGR